MTSQLSCSIGQCTHAGSKAVNQDSHGTIVPDNSQLTSKGIAVALADGISSSDVSDVASQTAIRSFLEDYYCTSETWTVKTSVQRVLRASNSWLYAHNQRNHDFRLNKDKGYVCTFSALVFKSSTAYLFHVGDAQVFRLAGGGAEPLVEPHRVWVSPDKHFLSRALGIKQDLDIDYRELSLELGDTFVLATDGVYEFIEPTQLCATIEAHNDNLELAAEKIVQQAIELGSDDNLTVQIVRVDSLPRGNASEYLQGQNNLPFPPVLQARMTFDGFKIVRNLYKSARSHAWLACDLSTKENVVIKVPSTESQRNSDYIERFLLEEWIANRVNNAHVLKAFSIARRRNFCYTVNEYIEGTTLAQWMVDTPSPSLDEVRRIVTQIAKGLYAFHRQEMLHQDLRPNNVMIDASGTVKIIDFGSTFVSGINESQTTPSQQYALGTAQFIAPEYYLGELGTKQSDLYSLACITYHMLCGRSPYGASVARTMTRVDQMRLIYQSASDGKQSIPTWVDQTLRKGLQVNPQKRYSEISEFIHDLNKPNPKFIAQSRPPLMERNPLRFWQSVSALLTLIIALLVWQLMHK